MLQTKYIKLRILLLTLALVCIGILVLNGTFASKVTYDTSTAADLPTNSGHYNAVLSYQTANNSYVELINNGVYTDASFSTDMFWCPGRTEIVYLKVQNKESFPVNYSLSLLVSEESNDNYFLTDTMSYAVHKGLKRTDPNHPESWSDYVKACEGGQAQQLSRTSANPLFSDPQPLEPGNGEAYLALAIHMDENASSAYKNKNLSLKIELRIDSNSVPGGATE